MCVFACVWYHAFSVCLIKVVLNPSSGAGYLPMTPGVDSHAQAQVKQAFVVLNHFVIFTYITR